MKILGLDLGKFKSVGCLLDSETNASQFSTVPTSPIEFWQWLSRLRPEVVVFETCTIAGWVADLCEEFQLKYVVANTLDEAWQWRRVKRKTDRDDALKLARMYALGQLPTVTIPPKETREFRSLVKYRSRLVVRRVSLQNHIRAVCQRAGMSIGSGHRAWTATGLELLHSLAKPLTRKWREFPSISVSSLLLLVTQARELLRAHSRLIEIGQSFSHSQFTFGHDGSSEF